MYSRKFNQSSIPPDYSGISFRQREYDVPAPPPIQKEEEAGSSAPRYPVEDRHCQMPPRKFKFKSVPPIGKQAPCSTSKPDAKPEERPKAPLPLGSLLSHSFTMEDIVLAGLILLLLNSECDNELLLVLGFLLLVGLQ